MNVLVVVDMQKDFVSGALGSSEAVSALENVASLIENFDGDEIIFTLDTHRNNCNLENDEGEMKNTHCIIGTDGWKLEDKVRYAKEKFGGKAICVFKNTESSEDLFKNIKEIYWMNKFKKEDLNIYIVGMFTDTSVISNALGMKGFCPNANIYVKSDCCAGTCRESHEKALDIMSSCGIKIENYSNKGV